jgi:BMFP domain-containing protein YqiC
MGERARKLAKAEDTIDDLRGKLTKAESRIAELEARLVDEDDDDEDDW